MDPGAALQALRKIRLVIERACHRALPLIFDLNLRERTRRAQGAMEPAEIMLEHRRVPEIGCGKELAVSAAGEGREVEEEFVLFNHISSARGDSMDLGDFPGAEP